MFYGKLRLNNDKLAIKIMPRTMAFKTIVSDANEEIIKFEKTRHHKALPMGRVNGTMCKTAWNKQNGRCVYCGIALHYSVRFRFMAASVVFDLPLKKGGLVEQDNIVLVCPYHKERYGASKPLRERIPDINTFADLVEQLFRSVSNDESREKIRMIKHEIDCILEDIAIHGQYRVFNEDRPAIIERDNLISNILDKMAKGEDVHNELVDRIKTIHVSGSYKRKI